MLLYHCYIFLVILNSLFADVPRISFSLSFETWFEGCNMSSWKVGKTRLPDSTTFDSLTLGHIGSLGIDHSSSAYLVSPL